MNNLSDIFITGPSFNQSGVCGPILRSLPEWFGIEASTLEYINCTDTQPTFVAHVNKQVAGFLTLKKHNTKSWEIYVMGVYPKYHRQGIGAKLIKSAEDFLRAGSCKYLQVKTLGPSHKDINYAKTRKFYLSQDYIPLEEFTELWDPASPCLLLVKKL